MIDLKSMKIDDLTSYTATLGEPKYRAAQLFDWLHVKKARSYDEMTNLSKKMRQNLMEAADPVILKPLDVRISAIDGTRKYLFELPDGNTIESVFLKYDYGNTVCISSQVGCRMGCTFCASTMDGCVRSLFASEMCDQIYAIERDTKERVSHVVVMGMGEPLDNYDNLIHFMDLITDEKGANMSERHITVSTCGLVPMIRKLADENRQITLALSLHAPTQQAREKLMPVARKYDLDETLNALRYYFDKTHRRISFEYALIAGKNDSDNDAATLSKLLKGFPGHVNLIPVNPVDGKEQSATERRQQEAFKSILEKNQINVTIRRAMGRDIDGACGQLRRRTNAILRQDGSGTGA